MNLQSIIAAALFYLLPFLVGRAFFYSFFLFESPKNFTKLKHIRTNIQTPAITYFITGASLIFGLTVAIYYLSLIFIPGVQVLNILAIIFIVLALIAVVVNLATLRIRIQRSQLLLVSGVGLLTGLVYAIWQFQSPYPFNWDLYEHQTLVNDIINGHYSYFTSRISDTFGFDGYSTLFHTIMTYSQLLFQIDVFTYWHAVSIFHFFFLILASYILALKITENKAVAVFSALIGGCIFESTMAFTTLFFIPQTFTAFVFIFLFIQLLSYLKKSSLPPLTLVLFSTVFLIFCHYIIGLFAAAIYLATYLYFRYRVVILSKVNVKAIFIIGVILATIAVILSSFLNLGFINKGEGEAFSFTFAEKFITMRQSYGFFLPIFMLIGTWAIVKRKHEHEVVVLGISLVGIALTLLQIPYVIKFYVISRFFIHIVLAVGVFTIWKALPNRLFKGLFSLLFIFTLLGVFIINGLIWKNFLHYHKDFTQISKNEVEAAEFLKANYGNSRALLVSDPATQHLLETLSGVNTQGGAYSSKQTRKILNTVSRLYDPAVVAEELYKIEDNLTTSDKRILALSGRYFLWQSSNLDNKYSLAYDVWYPVDLTFSDEKYINFLLSDQNHYKMVYKNPSIVLLEVSE